ncbi:putative ribonuclease H domain-containing protein [Arabidopsis thaliana]
MLWLGLRAIPRVQTVLEVELEAMRWAALSMSRFNYKKVIFESDSQHLVSLLGDDTDYPNLAPRIQDIRHIFQQFEEVKVVHIKREGNSVADRIARESLSLLNYDPKMYSIVPAWIKDCVYSDSV